MENRIVSDPRIFEGKPIIRGMRISVEMVLDLLSQGMTPADIIAEYPLLQAEDIAACLRYAKEVVECEESELVSVANSPCD